ncbi:hypothetical protein [Vibrio sp. D431a]|uniref:hypothetical protein n=1 Tax=Vibrio sp. D431a TaxID=2837388 RepID=UPI002552595B|nr:hypothetical protein [Vibrio sp. D431a]MDK9793290.1 hypothetical protein [Vibrio sp. D431a]
MKVSDIRRKLLSQAYKATSLATKAKKAKNDLEINKWTVIAKLNRDYISYIDYVSANPIYYRKHKESIAQKLYWVLSHVEKCDILINETKQNL